MVYQNHHPNGRRARRNRSRPGYVRVRDGGAWHDRAARHNELAVGWPVLPAGVGHPAIASVGTDDHVVVVPERLFRSAIRVGAVGVVLAHNHPVGTGPSAADRAATRRLVAAARILDVPLVAHLVGLPDVVYEVVAEAGRGVGEDHPTVGAKIKSRGKSR